MSLGPPHERSPLRAVLAVAVLTLLVLGAYWPVANHDFLNFDDPTYVTDNHVVTQGLTWGGIRWAFTTGHFSNWHPLTWVSHMLDVELFGLDAGAHHAVNLLFHLVNTLLLLVVLRRLTGAFWPSYFVAAWFALHPLHVESVAWISERKDLLSAFFALLTFAAYTGYAQRRSWWRYLLVLLLFTLGLMSKPMVVTLPFVLLLLDYWPLNRLTSESGRMRWDRAPFLVLEKVPLFALTAASALITFVVQRAGGAVGSFERFSLTARLANAVTAYGVYLVKTVWPAKLAVVYPHPGNVVPWVPVLLSLAALLLITGIALWQARRRPFLLVGWLWFTGMLVPVIGLVQVGEQAYADRYTYLPLVGVFIMVIWGGVSLTRGRGRIVAGAFAGACTLALAASAQIQAGYWRDSVTLFRHALAVTDHNYVAHTSLGSALLKRGELEEAHAHFQTAHAIKPDYPEALNNLGFVYLRLGNMPEALGYLETAVDNYPTYVEAHINLGIALAQIDRVPEAVAHLEYAVARRPADATARFNLGMAHLAQNDAAKALTEFEQARALNPDDVEAHFMVAAALAGLERLDEAAAAFEHVLDREPGHREARRYLRRIARQLDNGGDPP
jgi:protein O-mannosyl-transferase